MKTKHLLGALLSFICTIIFLAVAIMMKKRYILYPSKKSITNNLY